MMQNTVYSMETQSSSVLSLLISMLEPRSVDRIFFMSSLIFVLMDLNF